MNDAKRQSIFLEADDEITTVIERLKNIEAEAVNLIIPKEALILQSIVNVRLLKRAADSLAKTVAIETSDEVGAQVARAAGIMANGTFEMPSVLETAAADTLKAWTEDSLPESPAEDATEAVKEPQAEKKPPRKSFELSIPFLKLKSKNVAYLASALVVLLFIIYLALVPRATVLIFPSTEGKAVSSPVTVSKGAETGLNQGIVAGEEAAASKNKTVKFPATGTKDIGERAKGKVRIVNDSNTVDISLKKGAKITAISTGRKYELQEDIAIDHEQSKFGIDIVAEAPGDEFNISGVDKKFRLPSPYEDTNKFDVENTSPISGGTHKNVKIPSQQDIDTRTKELVDELAPQVREELEKKFVQGRVVESSISKKTEAKPTPQIDQEAPNGEFELAVTYSETALVFDEGKVKELLESTIASTITAEQKTYGLKGGVVTYIVEKPLENGKMTLKAEATVLVGQSFDEALLKKELAGKDVTAARKVLSSKEGIEDFALETRPRWYRRIPRDVDRVIIKIEVRE